MLVITPTQSFAGQMTSMMAIWYVELLLFYVASIYLFQAGYKDAERDCRSRQTGEFEAGEIVNDNGRVLRWSRDLFNGSRFVERSGPQVGQLLNVSGRIMCLIWKILLKIFVIFTIL